MTMFYLLAALLMMGFGLWRARGQPSSPRGSICAWSVWALAKNRHRWKIQLGATLATNPFFLNFFQGNISRGKLKGVCVPGLNCYSCPAAAASCPIGAVQAVIGSSKFHFCLLCSGFSAVHRRPAGPGGMRLSMSLRLVSGAAPQDPCKKNSAQSGSISLPI